MKKDSNTKVTYKMTEKHARFLELNNSLFGRPGASARSVAFCFARSGPEIDPRVRHTLMENIFPLPLIQEGL